MNLVQIVRNGAARSVAVVDGNLLRLLGTNAPASAYALALQAISTGSSLQSLVEQSLGSETVSYDAVYEGKSEWRLLPSFDHPVSPAHCMVSGTGLTHKTGAENRAAMHKRASGEVTDSIRMYQMGLKGGSPARGEIGVQPEWFFKGNGSVLRGHNDGLEVPAYAWDGGEEPEIAGAYVISSDGKPYRVGLTIGNEFSDHKMEKENYLYLAPSKMRNCAIGPELVIGSAPFEDTPGEVAIQRKGATVWRTGIFSGEKNMSHSIQNIEHHHFKYAAHCSPGDCHVHFFGADTFSFADAVVLEDGDIMEVSFTGFGRPLRNHLQIAPVPQALVTVMNL